MIRPAMAEGVAGLPAGNNSTAKAVIESCAEKMLSEIRVAASNNQAMALSLNDGSDLGIECLARAWNEARCPQPYYFATNCHTPVQFASGGC